MKSYTQEEIKIVKAKVDELKPQLIDPLQPPEVNIRKENFIHSHTKLLFYFFFIRFSCS